MSTIPSRAEISVYKSLDEETACKHFLGKNNEEAEALFRHASLLYQEDLMWMGPAAFNYYIVSALRYMLSDAAVGDSSIINCFAGILEFRLSVNSSDLRPVARDLSITCAYVLNHYGKFDIDLSIYGDLRPRFAALEEQLAELWRA